MDQQLEEQHLFEESNVAWMKLIFYGLLNSQSCAFVSYKEDSGVVECERRPGGR